MAISYTDILLTTLYEETLEQTVRKQNICESPTNITDNVFEFFETLECTLRRFMMHKTLLKSNKLMYRHMLEELLSHDEMKNAFLLKCFNFQYSDSKATTVSEEK